MNAQVVIELCIMLFHLISIIAAIELQNEIIKFMDMCKVNFDGMQPK